MDSGVNGEHMDCALERVEEEFSWQKESAAALFQKMGANTAKACASNIAPAIWSHVNIQVNIFWMLFRPPPYRHMFCVVQHAQGCLYVFISLW